MNRLEFKSGVRLHPLHLERESITMLHVAMLCAPKLIDGTVVVTSGCDGVHATGSLHYVGRAWDIRFMGDRTGAIACEPSAGDDQEEVAARWAHEMRQALPGLYDVVLESDHIHMEYDNGE